MTGTISQVLISTLVCTQFHIFWTQDCWSFQHYCLSSDSCIGKWNACDGNCPNDYPNLCDNGTVCYPNYFINDQSYFCADRSDEHQPTEKPSELDNSSVDKFLRLKSIEKNGLFGVDCQDGTMQTYNNWCKDIHKRMCGGVSTTDYFICTNSSLWEDRPCSAEKVRGCKLPGRCFQNETKCDGQAGSILECGPDDYSDEVCPVNKEILKNLTRYFTCKDNSALIHPTLVCDGYKHCGDSSDENKCNICPRTNGMVVHGQVVKLKSEEIRDFDHLKNTAIMKCESPYGLALCATPGDGNPECVKEMKDGLWQTQDEVELKPATLWRTFFTYMAYIFLISVVVLFKISQLGYNCQKYTSDVPILKSYHRRIPFDDESFPVAIPMRSFPIFDSYFITHFFTTAEPKQLTHKFRQHYILNHGSKHFGEFFNYCLTLSQFLPTLTERDIFYRGIYAVEAKIHGISPTCTDRCLKKQSSGALEPIFDAVYGSLSDKFPNGVKNVLYTKDKVPCFQYFLRLKTFLFRYFFFYYDIVQEYVLLSSILGTAGLGISKAFWFDTSNFDYIHIMIYLFLSSVFLPVILFTIQLAFSSNIGIIFGIKRPSIGQKICMGCFCFILSPFIPTVLFFKIERKQMKMFKYGRSASKALTKLNNENIKDVEVMSLKHEIIAASKKLMEINTEVIETKSLYKHFKEWELSIEMPIQSSLITIFAFMKKSKTVVNKVFQNWFISDTNNLLFLVDMSLKSIIAVQVSDESARRNNFLGIKSKMFLSVLYMTISIPRIAAIVIYAAIPLGLMDLLGHWTVEKQGNRYRSNVINKTRLMDCTNEIGFNIARDSDDTLNSTIFNADVSSTKYTAWNPTTYISILMTLLTTSAIINFVWLCFQSGKSFSEKVLSSSKSVVCIILTSDFDEDDEGVKPEQLNHHYKEKFSKVHKEYIWKLLLHTGINMALTFPWAIAFQAANERHQILMALGDCYGVKGTVEMEDTSLDRLWWGHWILPIVMAVFGLLNYGWFRIYVKHGHPWRRLLSLDKERLEEWKTLELWEMLQNKTDDDGEVETVDNWSIQEAVPVVLAGDAFTDIVVSLEVTENQGADIANEREKYKEGKLNMGYEIGEDDNRKQDEDSLNRTQKLERIDIEEIHKLKLKSDDKAEDVIFRNVSTNDKIHEKLHDDNKTKVQDSVKGSVPINNDVAVEQMYKDRYKEENKGKENKLTARDLCKKLVDNKRREDEEDDVGNEHDSTIQRYGFFQDMVYHDIKTYDEIHKENVSIEENLEEEQMDANRGHNSFIESEKISTKSDLCIKVSVAERDKIESILKKKLKHGDDDSDIRKTKDELCRKNGKQNANDRKRINDMGTENIYLADEFCKDLRNDSGDKRKEIYKENIEQEHYNRGKEEEILIKNISLEKFIDSNWNAKEGDNHEDMFKAKAIKD